MEVDELLTKAWQAVKSADIPEPLQEMALREAIQVLRDTAAPPHSRGGIVDPVHKDPESARGEVPATKTKSNAPIADPAEFWGRLSAESGVKETDIRDILQLTTDNKVLVTQPTRALGKNVAEQARTVIALVASGRAIGLGEAPVDADAVRDELERKRCYQRNNFAAKHLGPLKGFNAGANRTQIVLTSKWVDEFAAAVKTARGGDDEE